MSTDKLVIPPPPVDFKLKDISLIKYDNSARISILPQLVELDIYQSLFSPLMKATLFLADFIGLYNNFPLVGEEIVEITWTPTLASSTDPVYSDHHDRVSQVNTSRFFISEARNISSDDMGRSAAYVLELYSEEMLKNGTTRIQRAYYGKYSDLIPQIVKNDLNSKKTVYGFTSDGNPEPTRGNQLGNIPNLRPIETIKWFSGRAVPEFVDSSLYLFFERFEGFYFSSVEQIIKNNKNMDKSIPNQFTYYYLSAYTQSLLQNLENVSDHNFISALKVNKRFSTYEKLIGGYFENELQEIDITNFSVKRTKTFLSNNPLLSLGDGVMNTNYFIKEMQNPISDTNSKTSRIRYMVTQNGSDNDTPDLENFFSDKFGKAVRKQIAFSQVFVTITIPGDTRIQPGEIIEIKIPKNHGFTDELKDEKYISGKFLITNVKHLIMANNKYVMVLDLFKDAYLNQIDPTSKYSSTTTPGGSQGYTTTPPVLNQNTTTPTSPGNLNNNNFIPYQRSPNNQ